MMAFPALAARHRPCRHPQAQPVHRRPGDRAGELGADRPGDLHRDDVRLSERDFIEAARALGATTPRILFAICCRISSPRSRLCHAGHLPPPCCSRPRCRFSACGVQPPTPAWGMMIFESQSYFLNAPWLVFIPGAAILLVALAFNLVGDGLRDALDPTQRGRSLMCVYLAQQARRLAPHPARRQHRDLLPDLHHPGRSRGDDGRAQCHRRRPASRSGFSSASTGRCRNNTQSISAGSCRAISARSYRPQDRCRRADRLAAAGDAAAHARRDRRRTADRPAGRHLRGQRGAGGRPTRRR